MNDPKLIEKCVTLEDFEKDILQAMPHEDYIILLAYRYRSEKHYIIENNLLLAEDYGNNTDYVWWNDWNEGQEIVFVLACTPVREVEHDNIYFKSNILNG